MKLYLKNNITRKVYSAQNSPKLAVHFTVAIEALLLARFVYLLAVKPENQHAQ